MISRNFVIPYFAKRRTETTYKKILWLFLNKFSVLHDIELWYQISEVQGIFLSDEPLNIVISFKYLW